MQQQIQVADPQFFKIKFKILVEHQFKWQFLLFLLFNYYLIEAVLSSSFYQMFVFTTTTLMPLNITLFILLGIDFIFKIACIQPKFNKIDDYKKPTKLIKYYLIKRLLIFDLVFLIIFIISYIIPYEISRFLRLIILVKLLNVVQFNNKIYEKIYIYPFLRKFYTIAKMVYIILLFSHYFGTWFFLIDQSLIDSKYYGTPAQGYNLYYQMELLAYTPIQSLGNYGRYLYGLYYMVSLITTIAYGDIIGKNPFQEVYVAVLMVISTISLALILQQFMDLVSNDSFGLYDFIKNYNSLKTCMDDSQVSVSVQNKIRSYLVYTQYQKRYHAHQEVAQKLTQKLQQDLKVQSYQNAIKQWVITCIPQMSNHTKQLCNICSIISFQAQSEVYQELQTVNTSTQCGFLYKISGLVEQYIQLSNSRVKIPARQRKQFNLSKMFLNFNMKLAYDSDQQQEQQIFTEKQTNQQIQKSYSLITANNRKLKCIKMSQFIMLDAEQFYQLVNSKKIWFKRLKHIKQLILSRDIPYNLIGDQCTICKGFQSRDHCFQNCPSTHLVYSSRIAKARTLESLINNDTQRKYRKRSAVHSTKSNKFNIIFKGIYSFASNLSEDQPITQQRFTNIFKQILNSIVQKNQNQIPTSDSSYDPTGLQQAYSLQHTS